MAIRIAELQLHVFTRILLPLPTFLRHSTPSASDLFKIYNGLTHFFPHLLTPSSCSYLHSLSDSFFSLLEQNVLSSFSGSPPMHCTIPFQSLAIHPSQKTKIRDKSYQYLTLLFVISFVISFLPAVLKYFSLLTLTSTSVIPIGFYFSKSK